MLGGYSPKNSSRPITAAIATLEATCEQEDAAATPRPEELLQPEPEPEPEPLALVSDEDSTRPATDGQCTAAPPSARSRSS
eukprot:COSAG01_NODE_20916_length_928_cov_0.863691_2_plen_81_part_00